jgi:hypothetical protein
MGRPVAERRGQLCVAAVRPMAEKKLAVSADSVSVERLTDERAGAAF